MKYYKGKYKIQNLNKYVGDHKNVIFRSHWERQAFRWCDQNPNIKKWGSECLIIPYRCATDGKQHRYFVDLYIEFNDGKKYCIEIKPEQQTKQPEMKRGKRKDRFLQECLTYAKNQSKWAAAQQFCQKRGMYFEVWTEHTLKGLGIKLLT